MHQMDEMTRIEVVVRWTLVKDLLVWQMEQESTIKFLEAGAATDVHLRWLTACS